MNGWELRVRPWRNRSGVDSTDEFSITAIHRERGWVLKLDRQSAADVSSLDPDAAWQVGLMRANFAPARVMTTWNVRTAIVDLIEADSAEEAIAELHARLQRAGFDPYVDDVGPDAFESEES